MTTTYRPKSPEDLTVAALRERALGVAEALRSVWKRGLCRKGTGLLYGVEIGLCGNVHVHFLYFGPFIPADWLVTVARKAYERSGFAQMKLVDGDEAEVRRAVREVVKYTAKASSPLAERWFDSPREGTHPELIARWEIATHGIHLRGKLGAFRARDDDPESNADEAQPVEEVDGVNATTARIKMPCQHCGSTAGYTSVDVDTRSWVNYCHSRGLPAFDGSRVEPIPRALSVAEAQAARAHAPQEGFVI